MLSSGLICARTYSARMSAWLDLPDEYDEMVDAATREERFSEPEVDTAISAMVSSSENAPPYEEEAAAPAKRLDSTSLGSLRVILSGSLRRYVFSTDDGIEAGVFATDDDNGDAVLPASLSSDGTLFKLSEN